MYSKAETESLSTTSSFSVPKDEDSSNPLPKSITFGPAGLLHLTFHAGVVSVLESMLWKERPETDEPIIITGVSAGCLAATALKMKISHQGFNEVIKEVSERKVGDYK